MNGYTMQAPRNEDSLECLIDGLFDLDYMLSRLTVTIDNIKKGRADLASIHHEVSHARYYINHFIIEPLGIEESEGGEDDETAN